MPGRRATPDRRVREAIARYGDCLSQLKPRQRRVLRLRAGVGERPPSSRARVAQLLDLSVPRVRRAERHGLRALERAAVDGCGAFGASAPAAAATGSFTFVDAGGGTFTADSDPAARSAGSAGAPDTAGSEDGAGGADGSTGSAGSSAGDSGDSGDRSNASSGAGGGVKGIAATRTAPGSAGVDVTVPLMLLLLAGLTGLGVRSLRR